MFLFRHINRILYITYNCSCTVCNKLNTVTNKIHLREDQYVNRNQIKPQHK